MLAKRIIPCLDVAEGYVVKGVNFINLQKVGDPVAFAIHYYSEGADELAFLDIAASYENRDLLLNLVKNVASNIFIPLTVGGGIRNIIDMQAALRAGADKISINTAAVQNPDLIQAGAKIFGTQCIVLSIDAWTNPAMPSGYEVFTHGGRVSTRLDALIWAKQAVTLGAGEILLTSMNRDGTRQGYDLELTRLVADAVSVPVIASGGVGSLEHLYEGFKIGKADAVLAGSIFHYGHFRISDAKKYLNINGVITR